jgi:serine phosphatase RsbU (regulator of sigma subunit)/CheY-like chemotaxis protein
MSVKRYILCVDDEKSVLTSLKQELRAGIGDDYSFEIAESGEEALEIAQHLTTKGHELPVVISDQLMPGMKGDEFLVNLNSFQPKTRKILLTGQASAAAVGNALNQANLFRFLNKPWSAEDICQTVQEAIKVYYMDYQLEAQNRTLRSINHYAQLMASELKLKPWMQRLLEDLVKETCATKALLALSQQADMPLQAGMWTRDKGSFQLLDAEQLAAQAPVGLLKQVKTDRQPILLANAQTSKWSDNPYFEEQGTRAVYCAPILKQDDTRALLYLEHATQAKAFEGSTQEVLNAVVGQMGISLDNVLLYQSLEDKVKGQVQGYIEDHDTMRDSIRYASRIQLNLIPKQQELQALMPESFVMFRPKDVLSGDFYWFAQVGSLIYVVAADCTGHGVPGALMSMLGISLLSQYVKPKNPPAPNTLLSALHAELLRHLPAEGTSTLQEGMDAAIVVVNTESQTLQYAGARRPALILRGETLIELLPDKYSVGDAEHSKQPDLPFTLHTHALEPGDICFLFSDGFQDQFGKASQKKFTYTRLKKLIVQGAKLPLDKQASVLESRLNLWQEDEPQTDDILLLGFKPI